MFEAVLALGGGLEGQQGVQEVGLAVAGPGPLAQVRADGLQVVGVVGEERGELLDGRQDGVEQWVDGVPLHGGQVDGAVLGLQGAQRLHRALEPEPGRVAGMGLDGSFGGHSEPWRKILHL